MTIEDKASRHGTHAIVVASAAVTLAVGVTIAALSGYLAPRGAGAQAAPARAPITSSAPKSEAPAVVLVPVTQELPIEPPPTRRLTLSQTEPPAVADERVEDDERGVRGHDDHGREDDEGEEHVD